MRLSMRIQHSMQNYMSIKYNSSLNILWWQVAPDSAVRGSIMCSFSALNDLFNKIKCNDLFCSPDSIGHSFWKKMEGSLIFLSEWSWYGVTAPLPCQPIN